MTDVAAEERNARDFIAQVEAELDTKVDYDPELGEDLGWFCLELTLVADGEEFAGDVDFELSADGVEPLYAEITVPLGETERRAILSRIGERIIATETGEAFNYEPAPAELQPLLGDLRDIHTEIFD